MTFRNIDAILSCNLTVLSAFRRLQCKVQRGKCSNITFICALSAAHHVLAACCGTAGTVLVGFDPRPAHRIPLTARRGPAKQPSNCRCKQPNSRPRTVKGSKTGLSKMSLVFYVMHALSINHGWIRA